MGIVRGSRSKPFTVLFAAAVAFLAIDAASAFNYQWNGGRTATALISTDPNAYVGLTLSASCTAMSILGGTCTITHTNKGTSDVRFWTNETADSCGIGATNSGNSNKIDGPGGSWAFAVTISARLAGGSCNLFYNVQANNPNHEFQGNLNNYKVTIIYV